METAQEVYINMDDSGVLHKNDEYCIYGGIAFVGKENKDHFIRKYKSVLSKIKCNYCRSSITFCRYKCPEVKDTNIHNSHKRWLFKLIKKEHTFAVIINNKEIDDSIMEQKESRGRYRDYAQRRLIKLILSDLIVKDEIDCTKPVKLIIRIDQQGTSTDTGRDFINDISKELTIGIFNKNYNMIHQPILFSTLEIDLKYVLSHRHVCIQAADLVAGETRKKILEIEHNNGECKDLEKIIDLSLFLP